MALKRKSEITMQAENQKGGKRVRLSEEGEDTSVAKLSEKVDATRTVIVENVVEGQKETERPESEGTIGEKRVRKRIRKLQPTRPFPLVPTSVSATGPRSAHKEGKNFICITRRNGLGHYMRRCKQVVTNDGHKTLHLSAMGAAIPLLMQLVCALPAILDHSKDEIHTEILTGTCEVQDEILPDDDDREEDITIQSRFKSTLQAVIKIGDGQFEGDTTGPARKVSKSKPAQRHAGNKGKAATTSGSKSRAGDGGPVWVEPEQEEDLMETV